MHCRVCGYGGGEIYWEGALPTYAICDCCGAESGVNDSSPGDVRRYRQEWIADQCPWFDFRKRPADWDLGQQLGNVPPEWR